VTSWPLPPEKGPDLLGCGLLLLVLVAIGVLALALVIQSG
jgi:hypothetical protein